MDTLVQVLPASIERLGIWRLSRRQETIKRAEDLILASLLLLLLTPLMAAAALAVKLTTPGPVLFRQRRVGQDGEVIEVLKFRTMYADRCDPNAAQQTRRNDPRITPVGRFLRRFSLDELPQLLNVIGGSMSLVGPRPHALGVKAGAIVLDTLPHYHARHNVKPGITGWAQINGCRGALDSAEKAQQRIVHDLYYILNWSLLFDLRIIKRTAWVILFDRSAF